MDSEGADSEVMDPIDAASGDPDPNDTDTAETDQEEVDADDEEPMPAFFRYGIFTVVVYAVVMAALTLLSSVDVGGPTLIAFTVGFLVFMTVYFASMWAGWLFFSSSER